MKGYIIGSVFGGEWVCDTNLRQCADRIIGTIFFDNTVKSERYVGQILCPCFGWLTDE
jgi:hypothetical protein